MLMQPHEKNKRTANLIPYWKKTLTLVFELFLRLGLGLRPGTKCPGGVLLGVAQTDVTEAACDSLSSLVFPLKDMNSAQGYSQANLIFPNK